MTELETLTVSLPPEMADRVKDAVATGDYESPSEVVRAALLHWTMTRAEREKELVSLRDAIAEGIADIEAGRVEDFDTDDIIALGRKLLADRSPSA